METELTEMTGKGVTVIVETAEPVQPAALAETVYVLVTTGLTVAVFAPVTVVPALQV